MHGETTFPILNEYKYQKKHGKSNTNLQLLEILKRHRLKLDVCFHAISTSDIEDNYVNEYVQSALSEISVPANYQLGEYALIP